MARSSTFTTYINAETDPGLEAAFSRQAQVAKSSYAVITAAALEATRATAGLLGGGGSTAGLQTGNNAIQARAAATRALTSAAADAERQAGRTATATIAQATGAQRATLANTALSRSLNTTATSLAVVEGRMSPLAGRILTVARAAETLSGLSLGIAGAGAALFALGRAGNQYAVLESRIRPFFASQTQANKALDDITGIAQRSRASLESVVEVYARLTSQASSLGVSQQQIARATEIASKAATLSGGTAEARQGALVQFSQALGANFRGSGQELQSLAEGAPQLLQAIAAGFKNADGSIGTTQGNLRKLAQQGELTSQQVLDALDRSASSIDQKFGRLPLTLNQAGTAFSNSLVTLVGRFDKSIGLTSNLASGIEVIANNLRAVVGLAVGLGAAFAGVRVVNLAKQGVANVQSIIDQRLAIKELDAAWVRDAEVTATAFATRLTELEEERVSIGKSILSIEARSKAEQEAAAAGIAAIERETAAAIAGYARQAEAAAAVAVQARANGGVVITGSQTIRGRAYPTSTSYESALGQVGGAISAGDAARTSGVAAQTAAEAEAAERAAKADAELTARRAALAAANRETEATTAAYGAAQAKLVTATENVAARSGFFKSALTGLLGVFDPLTLVIGVATTAMYLLATAETQAEKATRLHEVSQRAFGEIIDRTTGKIYANVDALQRLEAQKKATADLGAQVGTASNARDAIVERLQALTTKRVVAIPGGEGATYLADRPASEVSPAQRQLAGAVAALAQNQPGSLKVVADLVATLRDKIPGLSDAASQIAKQASDFRAAGRAIQQTRAGQRLSSGQGRAGDLEILRGQEPTIVAPGKKRTSAQINAAAQAEAAQTDVQRARANLAEVRANGPNTGESDIEYQHRLAAAMQQVTSAVSAQAAARKGAAAAAREQRKEESNEKTEALQAAGVKRDQDLAALYDQGLNPQSDDYKKKRDAILNTYDEEVAKIRGLKNEHTALAAATEADAKATAAYVKKMGETRTEILSAYDEAPRAIDTADKRKRQLQDAVGTTFNGVVAATADNPLGKGIYTQAIADADKQRIDYGVGKPLRDLQRDQERGLEIAKLTLAGRDDEAAALQKTYSLVDGGLRVTRDQYAQLVRNEQQELRINDALASRQRVVGLIQGSVDAARDSTEKFLTDLGQGKPGDAISSFFKSFQTRFNQINARQLTEKLFAGADDKVRALISGTSGVDSATADYVDSLGQTKTSAEKLAASFDSLAQRVDQAGVQPSGVGGTDVGASAANTGAVIANSLGGSSATQAIAAVAAVAAGKISTTSGYTSGGAATADGGEPIVVTAHRTLQAAKEVLETKKTPSPQALFNTLGKVAGTNIDNALHGLFGTGLKDAADGVYDISKKGFLGLGDTTAFKKLGDVFGTALKGAGTGARIQSALAPIGKALGVKTSKTGAEVGGAIGGLSGIPGGEIIGSIAGSIIGGLFKKISKSSSTITLNSAGELAVGTTTGSSKSTKATATGEANSVIDGINSIAEALGGTVTSAGGVSIGTRKKKFVVDTTGQGRTKGSGTQSYDTQEEAIQAAVADLVKDGVIGGISDASKKILESGQDLSKAIQKATVIESIPKQLEQLTDPVRYAVDTLNTSFSTMISYLKEGGATAQQYADAQKLYELQRAAAINQAQASISSGLKDFLAEMTSSSSSVLSKRDTYANAAGALNAFRTDIAAGKSVDQDSLLTASKNFEDASRALNGSTSSFFTDFDDLKSLLTKAISNTGVVDSSGSTLPASPFASDTTVQSALASLQSGSTQATKDQTVTLGSKLDDIIDGIAALRTTGTAVTARSALAALPAFR
jgi:tape measure domain-containing protein